MASVTKIQVKKVLKEGIRSKLQVKRKQLEYVCQSEEVELFNLKTAKLKGRK